MDITVIALLLGHERVETTQPSSFASPAHACEQDRRCGDQGSPPGLLDAVPERLFSFRLLLAEGEDSLYQSLLQDSRFFDAAVPNESFQGPAKLMAIGTDCKTHGLRLTLDANGKPNPIVILQVESATGNLDWQTFELCKAGKDALEGKTRTAAPHKGAEKTYEYDISFKAPVNAVK